VGLSRLQRVITTVTVSYLFLGNEHFARVYLAAPLAWNFFLK
jgi:hypothetical protein